MNRTRRAAAERLVILLERETRQLRSGDLTAIGPALEEKRSALAAFEASRSIADEPDVEMDGVLAKRLEEATTENRNALLQALRIQEQIMGMIADAAKRMVQSPGYAAHGTHRTQKNTQAVALVVRA